jgi:hypothetical protein
MRVNKSKSDRVFSGAMLEFLQHYGGCTHHCIVMIVGEYAHAHCDNRISLSDGEAKS